MLAHAALPSPGLLPPSAPVPALAAALGAGSTWPSSSSGRSSSRCGSTQLNVVLTEDRAGNGSAWRGLLPAVNVSCCVL